MFQLPSALSQERMTDLLAHAVVPMGENGALTDEFKSTLREALKDVRIVALGESTHEDGATFAHKTRLVQFLHEELGFNVLAFEFGFYGNWKNNERLKAGEPVAEVTKYSGWAKSEAAYPVYEYMAKSHETSRPLHYAGFDREKVPDGIPNIRQFLDEVTESLGVELARTDSLLLDSLVNAVYGKLGNTMKDQLSYSSRKAATDILRQLIAKVNEQLGGKEALLYRLTLRSILMDEKDTYAGAFRNIVRDKHMAERVKWLADSLYPQEKIILWGASAHFARNMVAIERELPPDAYGFYPYFQMGDWLYAKYGKGYYAMGFTTASGRRGLILPEDHKYKKYEELYEIEAPAPGSFEALAYETGKKTLFCNLRAVSKDSWLSGEFTAYPFGHNKDAAGWQQVLDGFYFIREMQPDKMVRR